MVDLTQRNTKKILRRLEFIAKDSHSGISTPDDCIGLIKEVCPNYDLSPEDQLTKGFAKYAMLVQDRRDYKTQSASPERKKSLKRIQGMIETQKKEICAYTQ